MARFTAGTGLDAGPGFPNLVDAAIAHVIDGRASPSILQVGLPAHVSSHAREGLPVLLLGATSGKSHSVITDPRAKVRLDYGDIIPGFGTRGSQDVVLCTDFADPGDSGAAAPMNSNRKLLGLHIGGSSLVSVYCRIRVLARLLEVEPVTRASLTTEEEATLLAAGVSVTPSTPPVSNRPQAIDVLARTVWGEARGAGAREMRAVAAVVIYRVHRPGRFRPTIEGVCKQRAQFSC